MTEGQDMNWFLDDMASGKNIRISTGDGYFPIDEGIEGRLNKIPENAEISIMLGPIIYVDDEHEKRYEGNPFLRLCKEGLVTLFAAPWRGRFHYIVKDKEWVLAEDYHAAQAPDSERNWVLIKDQMAVCAHAYHFDSFIKVFELPKVDKDNFETPNPFIYLRRSEILALREGLKKDCRPLEYLNLEYDFLSRDEVVELLKKLKIFRKEMTEH